MVSETVALQLRDHQTRVQDWEYAGLARELHRWVEIFDLEFKLQLPSYPIIKFAPLRNAYANYGWFRGDLGTKDNITFNTHELDRDPALILRTLCHELIHLWQHYYGTPSRSKYHNAEFRGKAAECGLVVDERGCTSGHTIVFTESLAKYGVPLQPLTVEIRLWGAKKRAQKMLKWRCGCTTVRCATPLDATCRGCGRGFELA